MSRNFAPPAKTGQHAGAANHSLSQNPDGSYLVGNRSLGHQFLANESVSNGYVDNGSIVNQSLVNHTASNQSFADQSISPHSLSSQSVASGPAIQAATNSAGTQVAHPISNPGADSGTREWCPIGLRCQEAMENEQDEIRHITKRHMTLLHEIETHMTPVSPADPADPWGTNSCNMCQFRGRKVAVIRHIRDAHNISGRRVQECPFCHDKVPGFLAHVQTGHPDEYELIGPMVSACMPVETDKGSAVSCIFCAKSLLRSSIRSHLYRIHPEKFAQYTAHNGGLVSISLPNVTLPSQPRQGMLVAPNLAFPAQPDPALPLQHNAAAPHQHHTGGPLQSNVPMQARPTAWDGANLGQTAPQVRQEQNNLGWEAMFFNDQADVRDAGTSTTKRGTVESDLVKDNNLAVVARSTTAATSQAHFDHQANPAQSNMANSGHGVPDLHPAFANLPGAGQANLLGTAHLQAPCQATSLNLLGANQVNPPSAGYLQAPRPPPSQSQPGFNVQQPTPPGGVPAQGLNPFQKSLIRLELGKLITTVVNGPQLPRHPTGSHLQQQLTYPQVQSGDVEHTVEEVQDDVGDDVEGAAHNGAADASGGDWYVGGWKIDL